MLCRRWDEMLAQKEALDAQVKDLSLQLANGDSVISELHSTIADTERWLPMQRHSQVNVLSNVKCSMHAGLSPE